MAGRKTADCIGPSYAFDDDRKAAVMTARNCYPRRLQGETWMQVSTPGEVQVHSFGSVARGSFVTAGGRWFVAAGNQLYERVAGEFVSRGTLLTDTGFVDMDDNESQMAVVDGTNLFILTLATNAWTRVTVPGWLGSSTVVELDGYFVFVRPDTQQFYLSAIDDGTALDALDFSSADASPDQIVTSLVSHRQLIFLGEQTGEFWINSGDDDFPFIRYQSYTIDVGVVGPRAAINAADTVFFVGKTERGTGIVYTLAGNQPRRVSNLAVEKALAGSTDLAALTMWTYQVAGHEFIGINAPGLTTTWVYDAATEQWHERAEWAEEWMPLRSGMYTHFQGVHYGLDSAGIVTRLDETVNTLNGRTLKRERTWPHFMSDSMEPVSYRCVELAMKSGEGGSVALQISNDGGFTFGPPLLRSLGVVGRWMQRIRWLGLGTAFNRVFRVWMTDDVPFAIHSAAVEAD